MCLWQVPWWAPVGSLIIFSLWAHLRALGGSATLEGTRKAAEHRAGEACIVPTVLGYVQSSSDPLGPSLFHPDHSPGDLSGVQGQVLGEDSIRGYCGEGASFFPYVLGGGWRKRMAVHGIED